MPHLQALHWDYQDQLTVVELNGGGDTAYYNYDGSGQRVRKVVVKSSKRTERLYLGGVERYREYSGTTLKLERWTVQIDDIAQVDTLTFDTNPVANPVPLIRYQYRDHLGSASLETNEIGQVISYEEYHPFGTSAYRVAKSGTDLSLKRYRFTNKERDDETGLYYFGVRYYAAWLGRWTSSDPGGFVDGLNLYVYVRNNPVNGVDELGYETDPPPDCPDCPDAGRAWEQDNRIFYSEQEKKTFEVVPNLNGGYRWEVLKSTSISIGPSNFNSASGNRESLSTEEIAPLRIDSISTPPVTRERIDLVRQRIEEPSEIEEISTGSFWGDLVLGEIPGVGTGVDIANSAIAFSKGDILGGVLNGLSAIPLLGAGIKIGKGAFKGLGGLLSKGKDKVLDLERKLNDKLDGLGGLQPAGAGGDFPNVVLPPSKKLDDQPISRIDDNELEALENKFNNQNQKKDHLKGGKKSSRDRDFGIKDNKFWKAWEKFKQRLPGKGHAKDLKDKESAQQQYENWKNGNGFE